MHVQLTCLTEPYYSRRRSPVTFFFPPLFIYSSHRYINPPIRDFQLLNVLGYFLTELLLFFKIIIIIV